MLTVAPSSLSPAYMSFILSSKALIDFLSYFVKICIYAQIKLTAVLRIFDFFIKIVVFDIYAMKHTIFDSALHFTLPNYFSLTMQAKNKPNLTPFPL